MIWLLTILLPLLAAVLTPFWPAAKRGAGWVFAAAAVPALWLGLVEVSGITLPWLFLGSDFSLDTPRRIILLLTAILWATAGLFADDYLRHDARRGQFAFYFGLTMAGNFGLLISAEVTSFYTFFALMTFASYGLVIHSRSPAARRAARIYLVMAIIGELFLLTALYLAVHSAGSMLLADLPPALALAPNGRFIFVLGLIGFGVKVGAIPLYFWLPLAHPAAPAPASAVLSGAMIKAGLVGWMHLAPVGLVQWPTIGLLMVTLGFTAAFGAAIYGLTQVDPKTNLAYSSISQMGIMTVFLGIGLYGKVPAALLLPAVGLYAFNHGTAKALLFLGTALPARVGGRWRLLMWAGLALGALAIAGGPLTGGLWTKYLLKNFLGESGLPGTATLLLLLSATAITTILLLSRFLQLLSHIKAPSVKAAPAFLLPWVLLLLAGGWWTLSSLLLPAELRTHIVGEKGMLDFFLNLPTNWAAFWPLAIGLLLMAIGLKLIPRKWWPTKEPLLPPGDLIHPILWMGAGLGRWIGKMVTWLDAVAKALHGPETMFYRLSDSKRSTQITAAAEALLRRWEYAGIGFFIFFLILFFLLR